MIIIQPEPKYRVLHEHRSGAKSPGVLDFGARN